MVGMHMVICVTHLKKLLYLNFGNYNKQEIQENTLPEKLEKIAIGYYYNCSFNKKIHFLVLFFEIC